MRPWLLFAILLCLFEATAISVVPNVDDVRENIENISDSVARALFPRLIKFLREVNASRNCKSSLRKLFLGTAKGNLWAMKMIDAIAKPPAGFLEGVISFPGDYEECLGVTVRNSRGQLDFKGKYCLARAFPFQEFRDGLNAFFERYLFKLKNRTDGFLPFAAEMELGFFGGICVPSTCTTKDVNETVNYVTTAIGMYAYVRCETNSEGWTISTEQIVILSILTLHFVFLIFGTAVDIIGSNKSGTLNKFLTSLSLNRNLRRLFRIDSQERSSLPALRGFRVLSAFWIILGHNYLSPFASFFAGHSRLTTMIDNSYDPSFQPVISGTLAIETFLVLSGMLFVYSCWKRSPKGIKISTVAFILIRTVLRLMFVQAIAIGVFMILPLLGNGPLWNEAFRFAYSSCKNQWWVSLLFIQNYRGLFEGCLPHTWFLGVLVQLLLLVSFLTPLLFSYPKVGITVFVTLILIGSSLTGYLTSAFNVFSVTAIPQNYDFRTFLEFVRIIYTRPYTYLPSICIGVLLGYAVITKSYPKINLRRQLVCWLLSLFGIVVTVFGSWFFNWDDRKIAIPQAGMYRAIWSFSVSWMIFACVKGYGGFVAKMLSWKGMVPLDKISFTIYLFHPLVMIVHLASLRSPIPLTRFQLAWQYLNIVFISTMVSFVVNICFLQPLDTLIFRNIAGKAPRDASKSGKEELPGSKTLPNAVAVIEPTEALSISVSKL